jgi:hypothetical protein
MAEVVEQDSAVQNRNPELRQARRLEQGPGVRWLLLLPTVIADLHGLLDEPVAAAVDQTSAELSVPPWYKRIRDEVLVHRDPWSNALRNCVGQRGDRGTESA